MKVPAYDDLLGVKYRWFGRGVKNGLSCMGLALEMCRRAGIKAVDPVEDPDAATAQWSVAWAPPWEPMDILVFTKPNQVLGGHVGVFLGGGQVLHSVDPYGVIVSDLSKLDRRVKMGYRWKTLS